MLYIMYARAMPRETPTDTESTTLEWAHDEVEARFLGRVPYGRAWDLQERIASSVAEGKLGPTLLLLEHPHTYTFGRRGKEQNLLWAAEELDQRDVEVHWVDRGGDVTYHGPGQLVGYPLIPLGEVNADGHLPGPDYVGYLRRLERTLILALKSFGVSATRLEGLTGVWITPGEARRFPLARPILRQGPSKIAAIGVKVDARGVSRHGFALNIAPDMSYWEGIVPCGIDDKAVVSLADLLPDPPTLRQVADEVAAAFARVFELDLRWREPLLKAD